MPRRARFSFVAKIVAALALVGTADWLFEGWIGSWVGLLALGWLLALLLVRPATRRGQPLVAATAAAAFAGALAWDPGLLGWTLFWAALSLAALLPRAGFDDAGRWAARLILHAVTGPTAIGRDLARLSRLRARGGRSAGQVAGLLALPLAMTAVFVALFAGANPLIAQALAAIRLPSLGEVLFWAAALAAVWPSLRPTHWATRLAPVLPDAGSPGLPPASLLLSLSLFNAVFAVENALDLAFLWSGAPLPAGVSMTEYVHRGAYPLIATALLAGLFVLVALKPGSASAAHRTIRRLLVAWVAQNLLLVASSALRTCRYIAESMLTPWRIAALLWMALVAVGLALICWRMLKGRSAAWLINTNALAATLVLAVCTAVDLDAISAGWNVRHAREVLGHGPALDLCFLSRMGPSALLPMIHLEEQPLAPEFLERVRAVRARILAGDGDPTRRGLIAAQADWRSWTWHDAVRLAEAERRLGRLAPAPVIAADPCDPTAIPLTGAPAR